MIYMTKFISSITAICLFYETKYRSKAPVVYTMISAVCFSLTGLFVKFSLTIPPYQSIYSRAILIFGMSSMVVYAGNYTIYTKNHKTNDILITRGLLGGLSITFFFHALYFLPLSYFSVIQRLTPIYIGIIGSLFFNEPYKRLHFIITLFCFLGVILIIQPDFLFGSGEINEKMENSTIYENNDNFENNDKINEIPKKTLYYSPKDILLGVILLLINNVIVAIVFLTMRVLKDRTNVIIVVFYSNIITLLTAGFGQFFEDAKILSSYEIIMIVLTSICSWIGQLTRSRALFLEKAFIISILTYLQLILGYMSDYFILDARINLIGNIGILVIFVSMVYLLYKEGVNA